MVFWNQYELNWCFLLFLPLPPPPPFRWGKRPNDFNFLYFDFFFPRHFWVSVGDRSVNLPNTWPTDPASLELSGCHLYYLLISHVTRVANQGCASNPHSFFADSDPAVLLNADPDPAAFLMQIRIQLKKIPYKQMSVVAKDKKDCLKLITITVLPISLHFAVVILQFLPPGFGPRKDN